jgi:hypothetical protein
MKLSRFDGFRRGYSAFNKATPPSAKLLLILLLLGAVVVGYALYEDYQFNRVSAAEHLTLVLVPIVVFFAVFRFVTMTRSPFIERALHLLNSEASNSNFSHYQPLSSADYPRTYRTSLVWRAFNLTFGFGFISLGVSHLRSALAGPQVNVFWLMWVIFFPVVGILAILYDLKYRVVLFADSIEVRNLASTRVLRRDEILGRRLVQTGYRIRYQTILLAPRGAQRPLRVDLVLKTDSAFWEWMNTVPDLDVP